MMIKANENISQHRKEKQGAGFKNRHLEMCCVHHFLVHSILAPHLFF
jgi:hypothetical protein